MPSDRQGKIFLSYRRQETAWPARQLYEVLVARFGAESVFKDVDDIEPGDDFVEKITGAVAACDVLLALIGNQWLNMTDERGGRRLDNPEDFVRLEITAALSRGVRVVPILVDGAKMPPADQLPAELVPLTRRQAVEINPVGFNTDRLLATLAATFAVRPPVPARAGEPPATPPQPPPEEPWASTPPAWSRAATGQPAPTGEQPAPVGSVPPAPVPEEQPGAASPSAAEGRPPSSPETPDLPATSSRRAGAGQPAAPPRPAPPRPGRSRRPLVLVGAGLAVVVLVGALLVLRPWEGRTVAEARSSASATAPTPSASGSGAPAGPVPMIVAHRGGLEVHQFETQQAMEAAAAAGFSVETDVRYTADGVAVLVHDEKATKGLDCGGRSITVSTTTWAELSKYCKSKPTARDPAQYRVPRLDATLEGIAAASDQVMVFLELKTRQTAKQREDFLAAPVNVGLRDRTVVTSFNRDWLDAIAKADPTTRRMLFVSGKRVPAAELSGDKLWAVGVEQRLATSEYVDELKAAGLRVMIWVLNDTKQWTGFVKLEPDLVMTAYPAKFRDWLENR